MDGAVDPHAGEQALLGGAPLEEARFALVLVHGRGGTADGMLPIARAAGATDGAWIAPRAAGGSWYPRRFLDPFATNAPYLDAALAAVDRGVQLAVSSGIAHERIMLVGFSQGACLSLEYAARHGRRYGGVAALAGALIGDDRDVRQDQGDLAGTPALLACGDADSHIPEARVRASATLLAAQGAITDLRIYPGVDHTIVGDQLNALRTMVDALRDASGA
jgi:phospholipase/carboxylesterase